MVLLLYNLSEVNGMYIRVPFSFQLPNENDSETLRLFISVLENGNLQYPKS